MTKVLCHGVEFFFSKKVKCQECGRSYYKIYHEIGISDNPADGLYKFHCRSCGCSWTEIVEKGEIL